MPVYPRDGFMPTATALVVASDTPPALIAAAREAKDRLGDLIQISDGTAGTQAAINALPAGMVKRKVLGIGRFTIDDTILIPSYTVFDFSQATLVAADGLNKPVIRNADQTNGNSNIEVYVGLLDGNEDNQSDVSPYPYGLHFAAASPNECTNIIVQGYFINTLRECIFLDRVATAFLDVRTSSSKSYEGTVLRSCHAVIGRIASWDNALSNVYLDYAYDNELFIISGGSKYGIGLYASTKNKIYGVAHEATEDGAFATGASHDNVFDIISYSNTEDGIRIADSDRITIRGEFFNNGNHGINLYNSDNDIIDAIAYNNDQANATKMGIYGYDCLHVTIHGRIFDNQGIKTQDRPIVSLGSSDYWIIEGCDLTDGGADVLSLVGSNNIVRNNIGYVTENSGTATGTGAQQTIPHGLSFTPTKGDIILWNIDDGANPYHSAAPDATNIYITAVNGKDWGWATAP